MKAVWMFVGLLILAGCAPVEVKEGTKPGTQKEFFTAKDDVEVKGESAMKGEKKIAIPIFRVGFTQNRGQSASASAMHKSDHGTAHVNVKTKLLGVDKAVLQKITDDVYKTFLDDLRSKGFEVVDFETIKRNEAYASMTTVESPKAVSGDKVGDVIMVAPIGMKLALMPAEDGAISGFNVFSSSDPTKAIPKMVKDLNASVIVTTYFVDYVNAGGSGGMFATRANVEVGPGLSVRPGSGMQYYGYQVSKCVGYCPDVIASVNLGQAVYSTESFGEFKDVTSSDVGQAALGAVTSLLSGSVRKWKEYEMRADPQKYQTITTQLLKDTNTKLVQALADKR